MNVKSVRRVAWFDGDGELISQTTYDTMDIMEQMACTQLHYCMICEKPIGRQGYQLLAHVHEHIRLGDIEQVKPEHRPTVLDDGPLRMRDRLRPVFGKSPIVVRTSKKRLGLHAH